LYFYPGFISQRDGVKLRNELSHNLTRTTGWEAVMRMRCSKGMRIGTFHGHLFVRKEDLVALPSISADDTVVAHMQVRLASAPDRFQQRGQKPSNQARRTKKGGESKQSKRM
jgi:hypothetical protein